MINFEVKMGKNLLGIGRLVVLRSVSVDKGWFVLMSTLPLLDVVFTLPDWYNAYKYVSNTARIATVCASICFTYIYRSNINWKINVFARFSKYPPVYVAKTFSVLLFFSSSHRYAILRDPAGWLSVNPVRGTVNTSASLDRESPYVHGNKYTAVFIATDNGE